MKRFTLIIMVMVLVVSGCFTRPIAPSGCSTRPILAFENETDPGDTGNMHYPDQVTISCNNCKPLILRSSCADGVFWPYVRKQYNLDDGKYLVLGWYSTGSGHEEDVAMLISTSNGQVQLLDKLVYYRSREDLGEGRVEVCECAKGLKMQLRGFNEWPHESWDWTIKTNYVEMVDGDIEELKYVKSGDKYLSPVRISDRFKFTRK
jgi:hypothetical protein